jgi:hypothetical protein
MLHYSLNYSGLFIISLEQSKNTLYESIKNNKSRVLRSIEKQAIEENLNIGK